MEVSAALPGPGQPVPAVASLASALRIGEEVFREALQKAPTLPKLSDIGRAPATLADAILARDAKEEERRRREAVRKDVKIKSKQVSPLPAVVEQAAPAPTPGLQIGNVNEASAFWMFVEDYFRDVTQEDIMALLPVALDPEEDDCLTVPFLGRDPRAVDRPVPTKGRPAFMREEDDAQEQRRGRGRGGGKVDLRFSDAAAAPGSFSQPLLPQTPLSMQPTQDALVQGWRPDGRPAANMLEACTDDEARAFCKLAHKLGLLDDEGTGLQGSSAAPQFDSMDRSQLDQVLLKVSQLGDLGAGDGGLLQPAGVGQLPWSSANGPSDAARGASAGPAAAGDEDAVSSNRGVGHEVPRAACGDFMHPYLRSMLERPCTAYVLHPSGGTSSLLDGGQEEEDAAGGGYGGGAAGSVSGGKAMRGSQAGAAGGYMTKTPAGGKAALKMQASGLQDMGATPLQEPNSLGGTGFMSMHADMNGPHGPAFELQQLPPLPPSAQQHMDDPSGAAAGSMALMSAATPSFSMPGSAPDRATTGGSGSRGGRARTAINYSALAGKKDKEREREMREREKEERAKSGVPRMKRKPGPKAGASWGSGGLAGLQRPPTSNPLALLNKVPLLFKEDPGANAVAAAVHAVVTEGGPEGTLEEQWAQLDAAADVMSMAPDDEVLAELLALQSELVQQVAINRSRVSKVMDAVVSDLPLQRAANQQRAEMEEQIRLYLQRKAELKRNQKREKREMEKRQALAALNEPASPRPGPGRPKKITSVPLVSSLEGATSAGEGMEGAEGGWRGAAGAGAGGGGEAAPMELVPAAEDFELVDPLAQRTHDEEALCAICGDGQSVEPNMIVFCERCDIAVHQQCYGVHSIPADEWLCWPCRLYEESQRANGVPQSEIRPKRWEMDARGITNADLPGGSPAAGCCLCPVRQGAFKRTTDGKAWCHVVCGLWHEGPVVLPVDSPDAVDNVGAIKAERWRSQCALCQRVAGAVVKCNFGHCQATFHPLCGRRNGNYLVARLQPGSRTLRYRAYCHNHSEGQRAKDMNTGAAARAYEVMGAAAAPAPKPMKRGNSVGSLAGLEGEAVVVAAGAAAALPAVPSQPEVASAADTEAAAAPPPLVPPGPLIVKKRFGRPPKLFKLQQQQLMQMQMAQAAQAAAAATAAPAEPPTSLPAAPSPLPETALPPPSAPVMQPPAAAPAEAPPAPAAAPAAAEPTGATAPAVLPPLAAATATTPAAAGAAAAAAAAAPAPPGRPPLPASRLSLSAIAKRKAAAAAAAGEPAAQAPAAAVAAATAGAATLPQQLSAGAAAEEAGAAPSGGRATPSASQQKQQPQPPPLQATGEAGGAAEQQQQVSSQAGGEDVTPAAATAAVPPAAAGELKPVVATAATSMTSSGTVGGAAAAAPYTAKSAGTRAAARARQSSSGATAAQTPATAAAAAATTATSGPKQQRLKAMSAAAAAVPVVKEEEAAAAEADAAAAGPSTSAAAGTGAQVAPATAAATAGDGEGTAGVAPPQPRGPATLERLAELEHQRSALGRWGPSSIRQELELLRTMADTVRRRERCKRSLYRLLRDALAEQDTQPEAVLSVLENWEWPQVDEVSDPFSAEDRTQPPLETVLDRFLEAAGKAAQAGTSAAAGDDTAAAAGDAEADADAAADDATAAVSGGGGAAVSAGTRPAAGVSGVKRQRGAAAGQPAEADSGPAAGGAGGSSPAAAGGPAGSGGGEGEEPPPTKRLKLKRNTAAAGATVAAAAAAGGSGGGAAGVGGSFAAPSAGGAGETPRTCSRSTRQVGSRAASGGAPSSASQPPAGGQPAEAMAEVGSGEQQPAEAAAAGTAKKAKLAAGPPKPAARADDAGETIKEIMSGRDWRRRVVKGPDGSWVPRPTGKGSRANASKGTAGDADAGEDGAAAAAGRDGAEEGAGIAAAAAGSADCGDAGEDEVFVDAEERFTNEGQGGDKDGEDQEMADTAVQAGGASGAAGAEGRPRRSRRNTRVATVSSSGNDVHAGAAAAAAAATGKGGGGVRSGGGGAGNAEGSGEGGDGGAAAAAGLGGSSAVAMDEGGGGGDVSPQATSPRGASAVAAGEEDGDTAMADTDVAEGVVATPGGVGGSQEAPDQQQQQRPDASDAQEAENAAAGGDAAGPGAAEVADGATEGTPVPARQQQREGPGSAEGAEAGGDVGGSGDKTQPGSDGGSFNSDDAPIAVLSRAAELPREPRALMSQRTAEALNALLPPGYRFEKKP
ncbi:hypothetical protein Agub_g13929 [Astrephomene gubernaculifera]|uniref:Uncharacterized protein n=1 Tax=Astrephomene gubernaculifera TaxID=47775 RepID=A0AAD3HRV7_9CHLO|nr:hypothetical protein Agub_g13929 [Astrephomene gubernaculifera]